MPSALRPRLRGNAIRLPVVVLALDLGLTLPGPTATASTSTLTESPASVGKEPFLSFPGAFDKDELEKASKEFVVETGSRVMKTPPAPLTTVVAEGDPAASLIEASKGANLLVVGTRGRSPWAGLLLGSVSQRCAAGAPVPVVLVKLPSEHTSHGRAAPLQV